MTDPYATLAAGIAIAGGLIGTGMAQSGIGAAGMGIIAEKPEKFGNVLFFFVIPETLWIIGFVLGIVLLLGVVSALGPPSRTMSLDRLVEELRRRAEEDLQQQAAQQAKEEAAIAADRQSRIAAVGEQGRRTAEREIARERAQKLASAKLEARKLVYAAQESKMSAALSETRELLEVHRFRRDPKVVKRMAAYASDVLGKSIKVMGRSADAALLKKVAGTGFDPTPQTILGGIVAESADGSRRLNLSFDELLRLREDRVRQLLGE